MIDFETVRNACAISRSLSIRDVAVVKSSRELCIEELFSVNVVILEFIEYKISIFYTE